MATCQTKFYLTVRVEKRWSCMSLNLICVSVAIDGPTMLGGDMLPSPDVVTVLVGINLIYARKKYSGDNQ